MLCLAIPALSMRTALPSMADLPASFQMVKAYKAINAAFPGAQVPASVVVKAPDVRSATATRAIASLRRQALASGEMFEPIDVSDQLRRHARANRDPARRQRNRRRLQGRALDAAQGSDPGDDRRRSPGATVAVTGETAGTNDFNAMMKARMPIVFAFVLGLAFLLLLVTFRSIVVPLKAIVLNLLSVGAGYGVLVAVFQWGWGDSLLGFQSNGEIVSWLPMFLFVILFGLSMDYHVFILSRIKELVDRGVDDRGRRSSARSCSTAGTVTAAAVVMVAVFAIFAGLRLDRDEADGRRARGRGPDRRDDHPGGAAAGDDEAARRLELVPAALARVATNGSLRAPRASRRHWRARSCARLTGSFPLEPWLGVYRPRLWHVPPGAVKRAVVIRMLHRRNKDRSP